MVSVLRHTQRQFHTDWLPLKAKQGISKRFLNYMQTLDTKVGEQALGRQQTISGKVHATVSSAKEQAKAIDQQKGISKMATDVSNCRPPQVKYLIFVSIMRAQFHPLGVRRSRPFTPLHPNRSTTFMKRRVGLLISRRGNNTLRRAHLRQSVRALLLKPLRNQRLLRPNDSCVLDSEAPLK